jgi:3-dehydroquinate dehydratase-1
MICVSIGDPLQIPEAIRLGADLLEFRLDLIGEEPGKLFSGIPEQLKVIATCRPGKLPDDQRRDLLNTSVDLGAAYVDLEIESSEAYYHEVAGYAAEKGCGVIISYHNFEMTPDRDRLKTILEKAYEKGAGVAKIATEVRSREDVNNLLSLYELPGRKVVIGMGPKGRIIRVAAPYLGSEFTFPAPDSGQETASGQLSLSQLQKIYEIIGPS